MSIRGFFKRTIEIPTDVDRVKTEIGRLDETLRRYDERTKQVEENLAGGGADGLTALEARLESLAERLDSLDGRLTAISTELANQLSELGNDIEALNSRDPGTPLDAAAVDELRDAQTRLASEQARYQIAFREDLARLAEQLRRPTETERRRY
jgi:DNA repair exonuclease SbcCD ATPase subunit